MFAGLFVHVCMSWEPMDVRRCLAGVVEYTAVSTRRGAVLLVRSSCCPTPDDHLIALLDSLGVVSSPSTTLAGAALTLVGHPRSLTALVGAVQTLASCSRPLSTLVEVCRPSLEPFGLSLAIPDPQQASPILDKHPCGSPDRLDALYYISGPSSMMTLAIIARCRVTRLPRQAAIKFVVPLATYRKRDPT